MSSVPPFCPAIHAVRPGGPLSPEAIVGIDPAKVFGLAGALGSVADRAGWVLGILPAVLGEAGQDAVMIRPLHDFAAWCDAEQAATRATAEAILLLEAGPPPSWLGELGIRHGPDLPDFRSPLAAFDAASAAVAALASGDRDAFVAAVDRWGGDAVFAATMLDQVGASTIAQAVSHLAALTSSGLDDERRRQEDVVSGLAEVLDTARRAEVTDLSVGSLLEALDDRPSGELALLFVGSTAFDESFLVDAFHRLVDDPLGPRAAADVWVATVSVDDERAPRDSTTLVLRALTRNPLAASRTLVEADLDRLLVATPYPDGGAALARVLDVGTDPSLGGSDAPRAALAVISWVAEHTTLEMGDLVELPRLPVDAWAGLGRVGAHYIGSFRADHHDGIEIDPVSDQLRGQITGVQADRFLTFAARQPPAAEALRVALAEWSVAGVARIADRSTIELAPYTAIGDVGRRVSDAVAMASLSWAGDLDDRRAAERLAWSVVVNVASAATPGPGVGGLAVSTAGASMIDRWMPAGRAELDEARQSARATSGEQVRLEHVALAGLWARRADNRLFDGVEPPVVLLDGDRLRAVVELDADALEQFDQWRAVLAERMADRGGSPLDRLGAQFGATGARPTN